ncbi:zinc ribbon domain-containing protein [Arthrobacter mobilis]|uniref:DNA-binding protein n=1 Tax=Arthrobacter mobilis TaxID=2724944 RepID=A0A7X6K7A8_9MICC|nr:C4-type zinc ribbon domain-containing protein [Arthrobacter mobilis]NKX56472.1 DNA-binding protein [Arthrobacter mobilis]
MAKAPASEQLRLLDLQALDSKVVQLTRRAAAAAKNADIDALLDKLGSAERDLAAANAEVAGAERELARSEADVETVQGRIDRDQQRLDSGSGTSKDLTALQHELETLNKRRSDLEDVELEVMERLDGARERQEQIRQACDALREQLAGLEKIRNEELASIEAEKAEVAARRSELAATFDAGLLAVYEKTRAQRGIGAARLFHGKSEGSGMQLSPGDLADIRKAAEDDIVFCPDSGCILVRSPEWSS